MTLLLISFFAGILTIMAPCILPFLPVIVGRSLTDQTLSKKRLFVVILSLTLSVVLFTLLLKSSTILINVPPSFWTYLSGGIIFLFGLVSLFPSIWEKWMLLEIVRRKSNEVMMGGYKRNTFWGDVIVGASLGPIFSACSPTYFIILATILPVSMTLGVLYLFAFSVGLAVSLLVICLLGQGIVRKLGIIMDSRGWFKRVLGLIFILVAIGIMSGYDKKLQTSILESGFFDVTQIEQKFLEKKEGMLLEEYE